MEFSVYASKYFHAFMVSLVARILRPSLPHPSRRRLIVYRFSLPFPGTMAGSLTDEDRERAAEAERAQKAADDERARLATERARLEGEHARLEAEFQRLRDAERAHHA